MATDKGSLPLRRAVGRSALLAGVLLFERTASASPTYPEDIAKAWGVDVPFKAIPGMGCQLCHANDKNPDAGKKVSTLVGMYFYDQGLRAALDKTFATLLAASKDAEQDSDLDGISDYQELVDGTNPNEQDIVTPPPPPETPDGGDAGTVVVVPPTAQPKPPPKLPPLMQTGCSVRRSTSDIDGVSWLGVVALGLSTCARRMQARSRPSR